MICPEDYMTFRELMNQRPARLVGVAREAPRQILGFLPTADRGCDLTPLGFALQGSVEDHIEDLVFSAVSKELRIFHPQNGLFRLNADALMTPNADQICTIFDVLDREISFAASENYDLIHTSEANGLLAEDQTVRAKAWRNSFETQVNPNIVYNHFTLPWWHERRAYMVDLTIFDSVRNYPDSNVDYSPFDGVAQLLRQFSGAVLCVPRLFMENGFQSAVSTAIEGRKFMDSRTLTNGAGRLGRPSDLKDMVKQSYLTCYPNGHGDQNKGAVLSRIIKHLGRTLSIQTLDRAIKEVKEKGETPS